MSKANDIRQALPTRASEAIDATKLAEITGIKNVTTQMNGMIKNGEVIAEGVRGNYSYWRNPGYTPKRASRIDTVLPVKRKDKKNKKSGKKPRGGGNA